MVTVTKAQIGKSGSSHLPASGCSHRPRRAALKPSLLQAFLHFKQISTSLSLKCPKSSHRKDKGWERCSINILPSFSHRVILKEWKCIKLDYLKTVVQGHGGGRITCLCEVCQVCSWIFCGHFNTTSETVPAWHLFSPTFKTKYNRGKKAKSFCCLCPICLDSPLKYTHYLKTERFG